MKNPFHKKEISPAGGIYPPFLDCIAPGVVKFEVDHYLLPTPTVVSGAAGISPPPPISPILRRLGKKEGGGGGDIGAGSGGEDHR